MIRQKALQSRQEEINEDLAKIEEEKIKGLQSDFVIDPKQISQCDLKVLEDEESWDIQDKKLLQEPNEKMEKKTLFKTADLKNQQDTDFESNEIFKEKNLKAADELYTTEPCSQQCLYSREDLVNIPTSDIKLEVGSISKVTNASKTVNVPPETQSVTINPKTGVILSSTEPSCLKLDLAEPNMVSSLSGFTFSEEKSIGTEPGKTIPSKKSNSLDSKSVIKNFEKVNSLNEGMILEKEIDIKSICNSSKHLFSEEKFEEQIDKKAMNSFEKYAFKKNNKSLDDKVMETLKSVNSKIQKSITPQSCLMRSSRPTVIQVYELVYPNGICGSTQKSSNSLIYLYDLEFLLKFKNVVTFPPMENWDSIRRIMSTDSHESRPYGRGNSERNLHRLHNGSYQSPDFNNKHQGNRLNQQKNGSKRHSRQNSKRESGTNSPAITLNLSNSTNTSFGTNSSSRSIATDFTTEPQTPVELASLQRSANAWAPKIRSKEPEMVDGLYTDYAVERKVKSLLNKMTIENFEAISDQIIEISNQSKREEDCKTVKKVILLLFAKAVDEAHWSRIYAKMCSKLCHNIDQEIYEEGVISKRSGETAKGLELVRIYLLTRCQREFETGWSDKLPTNEDGSIMDTEMMSDEYYKAAAAKRRGLGLIRFIGELYMLGLIASNIIVRCFMKLLSDPEPSEESIESVCKLLSTVGSTFEKDIKSKGEWFDSNIMEPMRKIPNIPNLSSRFRFMVLDVLDLHKSGWVDEKSKDKGPKSIAEIHEIARKEHLQQQQLLQNHHRQNVGQQRNMFNDGTNNGNYHNNYNSNGNQRSSTGNGNVNRHPTTQSNHQQRKNDYLNSKDFNKLKNLKSTTTILMGRNNPTLSPSLKSPSFSQTQSPSHVHSPNVETRKPSVNSFAALEGADE